MAVRKDQAARLSAKAVRKDPAALLLCTGCSSELGRTPGTAEAALRSLAAVENVQVSCVFRDQLSHIGFGCLRPLLPPPSSLLLPPSPLLLVLQYSQALHEGGVAGVVEGLA